MSFQNVGQHISHQFDEDLESTRNKVLNMGGLVEKQVENSLLALVNSDSSLAEQVAMSDYQINSMEVAIDEECNHIIALRQPAASDLRLVMAIIKTITDLERVGDEAEKIGRYAIDLATVERNEHYFAELKHLGDQVKIMLRDTLDAFARMDVASSYKTAASDKKVNQEYDAITHKLIGERTGQEFQLGDRLSVTVSAVNIAERKKLQKFWTKKYKKFGFECNKINNKIINVSVMSSALSSRF